MSVGEELKTELGTVVLVTDADLQTGGAVHRLLELFDRFQHVTPVHSFTCGIDSLHPNLIAETVHTPSGGELWLMCPLCTYRQPFTHQWQGLVERAVDAYQSVMRDGR